MRKLIAILACSTVFSVGTCSVESWGVALGPVFNGDTLYGGIEVELDNGLDFIVPVVALGDNLGN